MPTPPYVPPPEQLARLAADYPLTTARLLIDAAVSPSPPPRTVPAADRWRALVEAHGPGGASAYLRQACALDHHPRAERVVLWAGLEGYVGEVAA